ncbi:MAG: hypothetical protein K6E53_14965 [Lachnospiraceae bacterium]|nr:hypothetical protein [Lachnospiraceae bacterium]
MKNALKKINTCYPYIIIALSALILLIRGMYSFCWSDETFYFSTVHRFFTGDSIFKHEWFPTQLSSVILLPFYALYYLIMGGNTGVILYFRIMFVVMSTVNSVIMFNILKQHASVFTSLACSISLMFYTHLNIATMSYYTMSVQLFLMSMLLVYHYFRSLNRNHLIISGILFAFSVLSLPTLSLAWLAIIIVTGIIIYRSGRLAKGNEAAQSADSSRLPEILKYTFIGIVIPAALFFIYLLCTVSLSDFFRAVPYVLSDEEHGTSLIYPLQKFFIGINEVFGYGAYAAYILVIVTFAASFVKRFRNNTFYLLIFIADVILFIDLFICSLGHTGYIQTALCLFTLPLFFIQKKKDMKLFCTLVLSGLIFSLVYSYSSNGYLYVLSMGHFISSIGCILILEQFAKEMLPIKNTGSVFLVCSTAIICACLVQTMTLRLVNIYRDAPVQMLNFKISYGPAKGLYTTADHYVAYNVVTSTIHKYCQSGNLENTGSGTGTIFITRILPFGYMCTDLKCAAPTTWRTPFNSERLEPYYTMNPDRYPDMILVLNDEYGSYLSCGDIEADPAPNENEIGGYLLDYVNRNDYEIKTVPCGTLYKRK